MDNEIREALTLIAQRLDAIESRLADRVEPAEIRQAIEDTSATAEVAQQLAEVAPEVAQQLAQIASAIEAQLTEDELRNALSYIRQFTSIMQGTRTDIVELRTDFRRLAALLEQTLHVRIEDEARGIAWNVGDADRRKVG